MRTDSAVNCGGGVEEWRLVKDFDTTGIASIEICFDLGESGATADEGLLVYASDAGHIAQVYCLNGEPRPGVDNVLYPVCVDLPAWAAGNPNLRVTFITHSENNGDIVYLDSVSLKGWVSSCTPTESAAFAENFTGCPDPITDGWNGWTVTGTPGCPGSWSCASGTSAQSANETWSISRQVDASGLEEDVELCFSSGDALGGPGCSILVEFDAQGGAGWQSAWSQAGNLGADRTCMQVCVNLSEINPEVNMNPALLVRFTLAASLTCSYDLDDISVQGASFCDGAGVVSTGAISDEGGGSYSFSATDGAAIPLPAYISCSWDTPTPPVSDTQRVDFVR